MQLSLQGKSRPAFMCLRSPQAAASAYPCLAGSRGAGGQHRARPPRLRSPLALRAWLAPGSHSPPAHTRHPFLKPAEGATPTQYQGSLGPLCFPRCAFWEVVWLADHAE